jgi:hypothetical protein
VLSSEPREWPDPGPEPTFTEHRIAQRRRWRFRMMAVIAVSYALDDLVLLLYAALGTVSYRIPVLYAVTGALLCALQVSVYLTSLGERGRDPFLTIWFVVPTAIAELVFVAIAPEVGFVFVLVVFIVYGFGALRLTVRETIVTWSVTALCVTAALPFFGWQVRVPMTTPAERWVTALCFLLTLGRCAMTGAFGGVSREHLSKRSAASRRLTASLEA